jgi:uncharacterized protein
MQCPNDGAVLVMSERSGVEIDYCPTCRGVWLDRGELDKILDRAAAEMGAGASAQPIAPQAPAMPQQPAYQPPNGDRDYRDGAYNRDDSYNRGYGNQGYPRKKKRENWLSELFD